MDKYHVLQGRRLFQCTVELLSKTFHGAVGGDAQKPDYQRVFMPGSITSGFCLSPKNAFV